VKVAAKTLLLDLDLQFGDAAMHARRRAGKTIFDLVVAPGELDSETLRLHDPPCVRARDPAGAVAPEDAELVTEAKLAWLLKSRARRTTSSSSTLAVLPRPMLATLDRTDELFLLCGSTSRR
jgi:hypothetical protein